MDHTQYTTNEAERKPGKHLTTEDRGAIQAMKRLGHSNRAIAPYLHCSPTTISNELKRGTPPRAGSRGRVPGYSAKRGDAHTKQIDAEATSPIALKRVHRLSGGSLLRCVLKSGL